MLRGLLPPPHGLCLILLDPFSYVIRLGKSQLCLYITVLSLALELGNALRVPEGRYREQTENGAQQDMPRSSMRERPCFHEEHLTPEFATLPVRYRKQDSALRTSPYAKPKRGLRPQIPMRTSISEYREDELIQLLKWIASDGQLRTDDQIIDEMVSTLGFSRRGNRIE